MKPLISIITVAFNSESTIKDTIESVLNQTYDDFEYWIVDGKSNDRTLEIAESYKEAFLKKGIAFYIISEKDTGIYNAMNKGIRYANGKIIGMINSDDWYELDALEKVAECYNKTCFDMMYADLNIYRGEKVMVKKSRLRKFITSRDWNHPTTFITKEMYEKYQYREKNLYDDFELVIRIRKAGHKVVVLNEILANFRFGGVSNEKSLKKAIFRMRARYDYYRCNGLSRWYIFECIAMELVKLLMA